MKRKNTARYFWKTNGSEELLTLREHGKNYVTSAQVIARGTDNWVHTLLLDKGAKDSVAKDMAAITPKGLAGKISKRVGLLCLSSFA